MVFPCELGPVEFVCLVRFGEGGGRGVEGGKRVRGFKVSEVLGLGFRS